MQDLDFTKTKINDVINSNGILIRAQLDDMILKVTKKDFIKDGINRGNYISGPDIVEQLKQTEYKKIGQFIEKYSERFEQVREVKIDSSKNHFFMEKSDVKTTGDHTGYYFEPKSFILLVQWLDMNKFDKYSDLLNHVLLNYTQGKTTSNEEIIQIINQTQENLCRDIIYYVKSSKLIGAVKHGYTSGNIAFRDLDNDKTYKKYAPWIINENFSVSVSNGRGVEKILFDILYNDRLGDDEIFRDHGWEWHKQKILEAKDLYIKVKRCQSLVLQKTNIIKPVEIKNIKYEQDTDVIYLTALEYKQIILNKIYSQDFIGTQRMITKFKNLTGYGDDLQKIYDQQYTCKQDIKHDTKKQQSVNNIMNKLKLGEMCGLKLLIQNHNKSYLDNINLDDQIEKYEKLKKQQRLTGINNKQDSTNNIMQKLQNRDIRNLRIIINAHNKYYDDNLVLDSQIEKITKNNKSLQGLLRIYKIQCDENETYQQKLDKVQQFLQKQNKSSKTFDNLFK